MAPMSRGESVSKPKFNARMPREALQFFHPAADEAFKKEHPVAYVLLVILGITALVLPLMLYIWLVIVMYDAPGTGWLMLGFVGSFVIGIGLFNLVAAFLGQYLGHWVTIGGLIGGGLIVFASCLLIFNKTLYDLFDQDMVSFYFLSLLFLALPPIFYVVFRFSVDTWLRKSKRISKNRMKKLKIGKRNFWWYEGIHREVGIGLLYPVNKIFTICYVSALSCTLLGGMIRVFSVVIGFFSIVSYLMLMIMIAFSRIQENLDFHGVPIVLFAKSRNNGLDSVLLDLAMVGFVGEMGYAHLMMVCNLWGIQLPHL